MKRNSHWVNFESDLSQIVSIVVIPNHNNFLEEDEISKADLIEDKSMSEELIGKPSLFLVSKIVKYTSTICAFGEVRI
jgi:hypothetical protein